MAFTRTHLERFHKKPGVDRMDLLKKGFVGDRNSLDRLLAMAGPSGGHPGMPSNPSAYIKGTTDDADAVVIANVATNFAVDLSATDANLGLALTFATGFSTDVWVLCKSQTDADLNFQFIKQKVIGGTNPTLGPVENLGPLAGGSVTFSSAAATAALALGNFAITGAATATGRYAASLPPARRIATRECQLTILGTGDLTAAPASAGINVRTLSTGVLEIGIRDGADANKAPDDTNELEFWCDFLPAESVDLAIASSTTPDTAVVGVLGIAATDINWEIIVYVGDPYRDAVTP